MRLTPVPPRPPIPLPVPRSAPQPVPQPVPPRVLPVPTGPDLPDDLLARLLDHRIVHIGGEIDDAVASRVTAQLLLLAAEDPRRDITVQLLSTTGSPTAAMAIHDAARLVPCDVATWALGVTAGVAPFLLATGTPGKRHAVPHARVRLPRPRSGGGLVEELDLEIADLVTHACGREVAPDRWHTAAEAQALGVVDHVG